MRERRTSGLSRWSVLRRQGITGLWLCTLTATAGRALHHAPHDLSSGVATLGFFRPVRVHPAPFLADGIRKINLRDYPANDKGQPDYLNISRFATPAQLLDLAKRRTQVKILKKRGAK